MNSKPKPQKSPRKSSAPLAVPHHLARTPSTSSNKRQRTQKSLPEFGARSTSDDQPVRYNPNDPSSSASSSRTLPIRTIPSLSTLCARCFAASFVRLRGKEEAWTSTARYLKLVPDVMIPKIFGMVTASHPTFLSHETIVAVRGSFFTLVLDQSLIYMTRAVLFSRSHNHPQCKYTTRCKPEHSFIDTSS
jgi:hypothetical protein